MDGLTKPWQFNRPVKYGLGQASTAQSASRRSCECHPTRISEVGMAPPHGKALCTYPDPVELSGNSCKMAGIATFDCFCNPVCGCLQEIMTIIKGLRYRTFDNGPHGVAVMVRQDIPFRAIHLQMALRVKTARMGLTGPYAVASIHLPPYKHNIDDLGDLLGQLPHPFLLLGDFNGWHHLRGDTLCNH